MTASGNIVRRSRPGQSLGFTVTELMVVIAIIALIVAILVPTLSKVRSRARTVQCLANQRQIALAIYSYAMSNASRLVSPRTDTNGTAFIDGANQQMGPLGWKHTWVNAQDTGSTNQFVVYSGGRKYETPLAITSGALFPYVGDIKVYISPDEPTNPSAGAVSGEKTRIRSYSLNACLGTTRPDELPEFDDDFTANMFGTAPQLSQYNTTTIGTIKSPQRMMCTIVEDDSVDYNNQGWLVVPQTPNWIDWPAAWRPDAITISYVDGSTEPYELANKTLPNSWDTNGHRWQQPPDAAAGFAVDWKFFRDRLNPSVIPNSTYLFGGQ
ncbi:MAG: prepilin-type N-terminal cleavage/methylation domain-containing protein [Planctomycetota bacterium]